MDKNGPLDQFGLPDLVLLGPQLARGNHFWLPEVVQGNHFWLPEVVQGNHFWLPEVVQGNMRKVLRH